MRRKPRRHSELTFHARLAVAGNAAEVDEVAGLSGSECNRGAGTFAGHARRLRILIRKDNVVLGAFTIDKGKLNDLPFCCGQYRIDLTVDRTADADIDHATIRDARPQRELRVSHIADIGTCRTLRSLARRRCRGSGSLLCVCRSGFLFAG